MHQSIHYKYVGSSSPFPLCSARFAAAYLRIGIKCMPIAEPDLGLGSQSDELALNYNLRDRQSMFIVHSHFIPWRCYFALIDATRDALTIAPAFYVIDLITVLCCQWFRWSEIHEYQITSHITPPLSTSSVNHVVLSP